MDAQYPLPSPRRRRLLAMSAALMPLAFGCAPMGASRGSGSDPLDYAATIREALQSYASDMQGYHFRATPLGNFGVGSIYLDDISDPRLAQVESSWYLGGPEVWLETAPADRSRTLGRLIAEGSLGAFRVDTSHARAINAQAGLAIVTALTGSAGIDYHKGVETSFQATEVRNRRLNWAEFESALKAGYIGPEVAKIARDGRFVVAAADIVMVGYRAEIAVDEGLNPTLAASLRANALLPHMHRASASFSVSENAGGRFVAAAKEPVVAAVLFKRPPPQSKALAAERGRPALDDWPEVQLDPKAVETVEAQVLKGRR